MLTLKWKRGIATALVEDFGWSVDGAENWMKAHPTQMTAMYESRAPEWEAASFIHAMVMKDRTVE